MSLQQHRRPVQWALTFFVVSSVSVAHATALPDHLIHERAIDSPLNQPLNSDACVRLAIQNSALVEAGEARVAQFVNKHQELLARRYPKLVGTAFMAPMFTVRGDGYSAAYETRYKSIRDWGPFTGIDMTLMQPLTSFGRLSAARAAAWARSEVEVARSKQCINQVARDVRHLYAATLFAKSVVSALASAEPLIKRAHQKSQALFDRGTGEVTQADVSRLAYGLSELIRLRLAAQSGQTLGLSALKQAMGLPDEAHLQLADATLRRSPLQENVPALPRLIQLAAEFRPEWAEIGHGRYAALKWQQAEKLAMMPTLAAVGTFAAAWTPNHDKDNNPWHYDIFNRLIGGVALALRFDLEPALAQAKARTAGASGLEVEALRRLAQTGIPLEVKNASLSLTAAQDSLASIDAGVLATRKWLRSAAQALDTGTGEARDLLEAFSANLNAKKVQFEGLQAYHKAYADLLYACGLTFDEGRLDNRTWTHLTPLTKSPSMMLNTYPTQAQPTTPKL